MRVAWSNREAAKTIGPGLVEALDKLTGGVFEEDITTIEGLERAADAALEATRDLVESTEAHAIDHIRGWSSRYAERYGVFGREILIATASVLLTFDHGELVLRALDPERDRRRGVRWVMTTKRGRLLSIRDIQYSSRQNDMVDIAIHFEPSAPTAVLTIDRVPPAAAEAVHSRLVARNPYFAAPIDVDVAALFDDPERYHGRVVRVRGLWQRANETSYLLPPPEVVGAKRIWITAPKEPASTRESTEAAQLTGVVGADKAQRYGHLGSADAELYVFGRA